MIKIKNLKKKYRKQEILKGVSFDINKGEIFSILGPNGSGKTTILKIILGMVVPNNGEVIFDNKNIIGTNLYRKKIGFLPQIARFPDNLSIKELIDMMKDLRNTKDDVLDKKLMNIFDLESSLNKKLGELSGGMRQKVNIILAFMFDAPLLILDEPTTGLDPISLIYLKDLIIQQREKGKTIILTTHIMSLVEELSDTIIFLLEGKIYFQGTVQSLKEKTESKNLEHSIANILKNV